MKNNWGWRLARLMSGTALGVLVFASTAHAQQTQTVQTVPSAEEEAAADEEREVIVVTGTRLRRETLDSPNPTVQVGQEEIENRQLANIGDAIERIPLMGLGGNNRGTNTQNGDNFILPDVLDLGSQRTLTLLNGRRIQPTLPGTVFVPGNASGSQVDLSVINPAVVSRVEVVAGTGGAIYGADAVGGVVNIITRDDYEGLDLTLQTGTSDLGDGTSYRIGGLWGDNFLDDRANITVSFDYFDQKGIVSSDETAARYGGSGITNPLDGSTRDTSAFSAAAAADALRANTALPSAFRTASTDGLSSVYFGPLSLQNPLASTNGVFLTRQQLAAGFGTTSQVVPSLPVQFAVAGTQANGLPFFAPASLPANFNSANAINILAPGTNTAGLSATQLRTLALQLLQRNRPTPYEYYQQNSSLNPLLFLGTFGTFSNVTSPTAAGATNTLNGYFPTIANTDPLTSALFPRIAVPLGLDAQGNLSAYNPGAYGANSLGLLGASYGGGGYDAFRDGHSQVQAGTERASLGVTGHYDITNNLRWNTELFYSKTEFQSVNAADSQIPSGSTQSGNLAVPVFIDQNPFLSSQALSSINALATPGSGFTIPTIGGQRVMYLGRALTDIFEGARTTNTETENYRILQGFTGDFEVVGRQFDYDVNAYYGRSETASTTQGLLDVEFALAVDVVNGPNGPVCRQQTLSAPEPILTRNPGVGSIVTGLPSPVTPTAAQIAACQPLNLLGSGRPSRAAIDYVLTDQVTRSMNTLEVYSAALNGELLKLPAGWIQAGIQVEKRTESAEFEPDPILQRGLTRTALQFTGGGERDFLEYGGEVLLPVFGPDWNFPLMRELEFSYAFRQVEREQTTKFSVTQGTPTEDDTFNYSFRWKPIDDLSIRGARSRTVRAASLVELFDPGIRAFGGLNAQSHPCSNVNIDSGPNPAVRRANCVAAVQSYGYASSAAEATTFLAGFLPTTTPNRPATAAGNPFLANETADTYTFGVTYEPFFIPRLTLAADFFSVDLAGELGLVGTPTTSNACFDSAAYPESIVGASNPACDAILFTTPQGTIPTVNPLTGRQNILTQSFGGQAANPTSPFEIAAIDFLNLNLAIRELRAVNVEARYNFAFSDLPFVGASLANAGDVFLRASMFHTQRYDVFTPSLNRVAQEHGNPEFKTRFEVRHEIGNFDHTLTWDWQSETVTNIQLTTPIADQSPAFVSPDYHYFSYFAGYDLDENLSVRLSINNLLNDDEPRGQYGIGNDFDGGVGRTFILGLNAKF